ncbi:Oidioi.mRNA.OKI2018_I69.XSR.g15757.t1.cds [Oikopleura dioica]|uniref:Ribulose-phosphate 3-epimerase n=1 Tax=Oikopleura dioica TaxID=34765 RepID=A0ABN7SI29_OIKDI|nr:Oidioi.mRNA.OKI2018_I69.XSR.g15757.t1.cds [Oikopleura dioica]
MPELKIAPSILNADLANLSSECKKLFAAGADIMHLDVMDGHFVPNLTFGHPVVESLRKELGPDAYLDVHLMVSKPRMWIKDYKKAGASAFTFHLEAVEGVDEAVDIVQEIGREGMLAGVAIKPKTPVAPLLEVMQKCQKNQIPVTNALVMTVEPGFGGQKFMGDMMSKVSAIREQYPECDVQVDGGVGIGNIDLCYKAGANSIVAGSAIIKSENWAETITSMRKKCEEA